MVSYPQKNAKCQFSCLIKQGMLAVLFIMAMYLPAKAGGIIGPIGTLEQGQFSLGLEASFLSKLQFDDTTADATRNISDGTVETYQYDVKNLRIEDDIYSFLAINYGVTDWITLSAKAGIATDGKKSSGSQPDRYYKLHDVFVWALGGKVRLWESETGGMLAFSAEYQRYDNRGQHRAWASSWETDFKTDLWRLDLALIGAWKFNQVIPYAGMKYTYAEMDLSGTATGVVDGLTRVTYSEYSSINESNPGVLAGIAWEITPVWQILIQGDFVVETAGTLSLSYRF